MSDLKEQVEQKLNAHFIRSVFSEVRKPKGPDDKGNHTGLCPFHEDKNPSFSYSEKTGQYTCFSCDAAGNLYTYVKEQKGQDKPLLWLAEQLGIEVETPKPKLRIEPSAIKMAKSNLWEKNPDKIQELVSFGISEKVIRSHNIGYKKGRFWIPIKDDAGDFVNIRKYDPHSKGNMKIISHHEYREGKKVGFGSDRLYPISAMNSDTIYIMEGEKDCLVARSLGLNAITNTIGAKNWNKDWNVKFKDKNVIICMDIDKAGREGALARAKMIYPYAAQVKIIDLPLDDSAYPKGDFTDWITSEGHTKEEFIKLVDETDVFAEAKDKDDTEYKVILAEASKSRYIQKKCYIKNVLCCGKDQSPYGAPREIFATCYNSKRSPSKCYSCKLLDGQVGLHIQKDDPILLDLIQETNKTVNKRIQDYLDIIPSCKNFDVEVKSYYTIEKLRIVPDITYNIEEDYEHVYRVAYHISDDDQKIETNRGYNVHALTVTDNKTQYIQHQVYELESSQTNIDDFELTEDTINQLRKFQVAPEQTISDKLNDIYKDFSRMAQIYGRNDLFLLNDLVFHSVITFDFQGKNIGKGWVEGAVIGDSGTGKSTTSKFLCRHYKAGEFITGEGNSYAGLVGGISQVGGNWQLQWGRIPLNDRRLVIIDEASGMKTEEMAKLSEIRSTGEAKIQKVVTEATRSRTRNIWLSNPRPKNLGIKNYPYGVQTMVELFGQPEDVRRIDLAMTVASDEVDPDVSNRMPETFVTDYDSESSHSLIMFAWSRKSTDIYITPEVERYVLQKSSEISKEYSSSIPLVEPADMRNKLIRMTVSLATRLFSVDDKYRVKPEKKHVDFVVNFLRSIYNKARFAYDDYSRKEFAKSNFINKKEVSDMLNLKDEACMDDLLQGAFVSKSVIHDCINSELPQTLSVNEKAYRDKVKFLKRSNAIEERDKYYILQPGFLDFLKDLKKHLNAGRDYDDYFKGAERTLSDGLQLD